MARHALGERRRPRSLGGVVAGLGLVVLVGLSTPAAVRAQTPAPAATQPPTPTWRWNLSNLTRAESWSFFEPPTNGGNPDYTFIANRLRVALTGTWTRFDLNAAAQYVQFGALPTAAVGPGPLGTGALYYQHAGRTDSYGAYVRTLSLRARLPHGVTLQGGRFGYASGGEAPSGRPKIEAVKRARVDSRMIGEFEWSLYQRTFDGLRGDVDRKAWHVTGAWLRPTQGGFEEKAGSSLSSIDVLAGTVALRPGVALPKTDLSIFACRYRDDRLVAARPDNSGRTAPRVDVGITTLGVAAVGTAPAGRGDLDWLAWFAGQTGTWYGQTTAGGRWPSRPDTSGRSNGSRGLAAAISRPRATAMPQTIATARSSRCCRRRGSTR